MLGNESVGRRAVTGYGAQLFLVQNRIALFLFFGAILTHTRRRAPSLVSLYFLLHSFGFSYSGELHCIDCKSSCFSLTPFCIFLQKATDKPLLLEEVKQMAVLASLQDRAGRKLNGV